MYFFCKTDKGALDYKAGETMRFTLTLREDGKTVAPEGVIKYKIEADGKAGFITGALPASSPAVVTAKCDVPGFVRLTAALYDIGCNSHNAGHKKQGSDCHYQPFGCIGREGNEQCADQYGAQRNSDYRTI